MQVNTGRARSQRQSKHVADWDDQMLTKQIADRVRAARQTTHSRSTITHEHGDVIAFNSLSGSSTLPSSQQLLHPDTLQKMELKPYDNDKDDTEVILHSLKRKNVDTSQPRYLCFLLISGEGSRCLPRQQQNLDVAGGIVAFRSDWAKGPRCLSRKWQSLDVTGWSHTCRSD